MTKIINLLELPDIKQVNPANKPSDVQLAELQEAFSLAYDRTNLDPAAENQTCLGVSDEDGTFQTSLWSPTRGIYSIHFMVCGLAKTHIVEGSIARRRDKNRPLPIESTVMASSDGGKNAVELHLNNGSWGLFIDFVMEQADRDLFVPVDAERILIPSATSPTVN